MMSYRGERKLWLWGLIALMAVVFTAMFYTARGARIVSRRLKQSMEAPGPPVNRGNLSRILGDVPLPPTMALDEAATNDTAVRLQALVTLQIHREDWVLVFSTREPYEAVRSWYVSRLSGWALLDGGGTGVVRGKEQVDIRRAAWTRNGDRVALVSLPDRPGKLLLLVSSPPPRLRGPQSPIPNP